MDRAIFTFILLMSAVALDSAESRKEPSALTKLPAHLAWLGQEHLEYDVSWSRFIVAGELIVDSQDSKSAARAGEYQLQVQTRSMGWVESLFLRVDDLYQSRIDQQTLLPRRAESRVQHGNQLRQLSTEFDQQRQLARLSTGSVISIPAETYDLASLLVALRTVDLSQGKVRILNLLIDQNCYSVQAQLEGKELIQIGGKSYETARIAIRQIDKGGIQDAYHIRLNLTTDSLRLPVMISAQPPWGNVRAELRKRIGSSERAEIGPSVEQITQPGETGSPKNATRRVQQKKLG